MILFDVVCGFNIYVVAQAIVKETTANSQSACLPTKKKQETYLRLKVSFLRRGQHVGRGDVQMQEDLSKRRPVSGLAVPVHFINVVKS